ncbi:redoxin domain-containing protein [Myroides injenensis]|uniref:redoxin domain-containing protein n=1 Tax=Myroides injenensis TaxID=1183151 RepID=UPI0002883B61|nr:redoxin domain-containing protein [Myroides injenensis]
MRKILSVIGAVALLASCNQEKGYEIQGELTGIPDGTTVYLEKINQESKQLQAVDSTIVKDNTFVLKGKEEFPDYSFIAFKDIEGRVPFILENGKIQLKYYADKIEESAATGTKNNDEFATFNKKRNEFTKKLVAFRAANQEAYEKAQAEKNEAEMEKIFNAYNELAEESNNYVDNYLEENPQSIVTLVTMNEYTQRGYLGKEEVLETYNNLNDELKESMIAKSMKNYADQMADPKVKIGDKAPDFSAKTPEGTELSLKDALGKVTIIDFWASWCGPCRAENPKVVALYEDYHDKGLNIIGVSLDKEENKWKEAIKKDGLTWYQISNLAYWQDPIAQEYEVKGIPATFILDENGVVIAKNLRGKKLREKISSILDK